MKLYEPRTWQKQLHDLQKRFKVIVAHRRSGKTTFALCELLYYANKKPGNYWYIAPTYKQAKMIAWAMLKKYGRPALIKTNEVELWVVVRTIQGGISKISLKGADNPDSLRGVGLDGFVLDELDLIDRNIWFEIIRPMIADTNGWGIFIGTFKGKKLLHELSKIKDNEWTTFILPASISKIIDEKELEDIKKRTPEPIYNQEFECIPIEGQGSVFKGIRECLKETLKPPEPGHTYIMGIDLARLTDFTVISVIDADTNELVYWDRFNQIDWAFQEIKIENTARRYNDALIVIDATGVGDPVVERLIRLGLNVEPIRFTGEAKKNLIEKLAIFIQNKQIKFPPIDELIDELELFTYEMTPGGYVKYSAPAGYHDDCVISLALAVHKLTEKKYTIFNQKSVFDDDYISQYSTAFKNPYNK